MKIKDNELNLLKECLKRAPEITPQDEEFLEYAINNLCACCLCGDIYIEQIPSDCIGYICEHCIVIKKFN